METIGIIKIILEEGAKYAVLAMGVYLTYSILDFPDLSVDGTMPLGAILSAVLILHGCNPWVSLIAAFFAGAAAGCITGLLHVVLKIRPLLCGILVFTSLLSVNLIIAKIGTNGQSIVSVFGEDTIFTGKLAQMIPQSMGTLTVRKLIMLAVIVIIVKIAIDLYLKTKNGMLLRATGANEQFVVMLAKDPGKMKILGLALGNALAALSGAVIAQANETANTTMGTGMVVFGLSSVIIGLTLFGKLKFMKSTTMVIFGTIIYKACLQIAVSLGLPSDYNKLLMVVLFVFALVISEKVKLKGGKKNAEA
ncbi:MAG: ABC transporter permease [Clostridia bacterium]|nr:ABC transporter permease [Clostridia bacterium]MBQ2153096.1 ABC transporter permease [Clostridia bacterium]